MENTEKLLNFFEELKETRTSETTNAFLSTQEQLSSKGQADALAFAIKQLNSNKILEELYEIFKENEKEYEDKLAQEQDIDSKSYLEGMMIGNRVCRMNLAYILGKGE